MSRAVADEPGQATGPPAASVPGPPDGRGAAGAASSPGRVTRPAARASASDSPLQTPSPPATAASNATAGTADGHSVLRQVAAGLGNVAILTALLVYFGWVRSEVQARRLGIDESILNMSTRDYLLRSVRPVLVLLVVVAVSGLLWVVADRWITLRRRRGDGDRVFRWALRAIPLAAVGLPVAGWLAGFSYPAAAYVLFPLCIAGGLLLLLYAFDLRQSLPGAVPLSVARRSVLRACTAAVVGIAVFTAAANYATVEGTELAVAFEDEVATLPQVVVYSAEPLHIDAPGVTSEPVGEGEPALTRYTGLRLLERTGGRHFLVSDGWTPEYGVVVVLDDRQDVRLEFVRDLR